MAGYVTSPGGGGSPPGPSDRLPPGVISLEEIGTLVDDRVVISGDFYMANADNTLITSVPVFSAGDVGKVVVINRLKDSEDVFIAHITAFTDSTHVEIDLPANSAIEGESGYFATDNADVFGDLATYLDATPGCTGVYLPVGTFATSVFVDFTGHNGTELYGAGMQHTHIYYASNEAAFVCVDGERIRVHDFSLYGPTVNGHGSVENSGSIGFEFIVDESAGNYYLDLHDIYVEGFFDNFNIDTPVASHLRRLRSFFAGRHGFYLHGSEDLAGTSTHIDQCFGGGCYGTSFSLFQIAYSVLTACASDASGAAYVYDTCSAITENACGSEETQDYSPAFTDVTPNGISRAIANSRVVLNSPYMIGNIGVGFYVSSGAIVSINSMHESSPNMEGSPTASLYVEDGCTVLLNGAQVAPAMNLDADSVTSQEDELTIGTATVAHGADDEVARPKGYGKVLWVGSVEPNYMIAGDIWFDNS